MDPERAQMLADIAAETRHVARTIGRSSLRPEVMRAMAAVPRHRFVPESQRRFAYSNRPLPIGQGQTISQPFIVALMTDLLGCGAGDRVLEIGTGSGYQAAVLAELGVEVYSVEIIPALAAQAAQRLQALGYEQVRIRRGDGYGGWPECGPYAGILITAATPQVPPPLLAQLAPRGRLVAPLGPMYGSQELSLYERCEDGLLHHRTLLPVAFVPFTREKEGDTFA